MSAADCVAVLERMVAEARCGELLLETVEYEALDAAIRALRQEGAAVGCLTVARWRGIDGMVNHSLDYYGDLPDGSYTLYALTPSPKGPTTP